MPLGKSWDCPGTTVSMSIPDKRAHPLYDFKRIRAVFSPSNKEDLNAGTIQMLGHEFVWEFVGMLGEQGVWALADQEDFDAYYQAIPKDARTNIDAWRLLWILEEDLDIIRVENPDA